MTSTWIHKWECTPGMHHRMKYAIEVCRHVITHSSCNFQFSPFFSHVDSTITSQIKERHLKFEGRLTLHSPNWYSKMVCAPSHTITLIQMTPPYFNLTHYICRIMVMVCSSTRSLTPYAIFSVTIHLYVFNLIR